MPHNPWLLWQGFQPLTDASERFATAARVFLDAASQGPAIAAEAATLFGNSLREQFAAFQSPWSTALGAGAPSGGQTPPAMADWPAFGATREHQQRLQRMADAWQRLDHAQRRLQVLWSDAMREAAAAFVAKLVPPQPMPIGAQALRELYDRWIDCAEEAYARMAHAEAFCNALAEAVNAASLWRSELQMSIEQWAKGLDLPTRSEVSSLARRLVSVEERLRGAADTPEPAPPARPARASRAARKPGHPRKARAPASSRRPTRRKGKR